MSPGLRGLAAAMYGVLFQGKAQRVCCISSKVCFSRLIRFISSPPSINSTSLSMI